MAVTLSNIEEFMAEPKPRSIPRNIYKKALQNSFGGPLGFILGIVFFLFGAAFTYVFFPWTMGTELSLDMGTPEIAKGRVSSTEKTSMSVGGSKTKKGTPIYRIRFSFSAEEKNDTRGVSYSTGRSYSSGSRVDIEYIKGSPENCRIKGLRTSAFGYFSMFAALFPAVGVIIFLVALKSRSKVKRILSDGDFAVGQITDVKATNVRVNNQTRHKISVSFELDGFSKTSTYNAYGENVSFAKSKMNNNEPVGVLYTPDKNNELIVIDSLLD